MNVQGGGVRRGQASLFARSPAVPATAGLWVGVELGVGAASHVLPWLLGLGLLGLRLRGWARALILGMSLGWALFPLGWAVAPLDRIEGIDLSRPIALEAEVLGCWSEGRWGWTAQVSPRRIEQDGAVHRASGPVRLDLVRRPGWLPRCGGVVRTRGFLRGPRVYRNQPVVRVGSWSMSVESPELLDCLEAPGFGGWVSGLLWDRVSPPGWRAGSSSGARLARALALGDRSALEPSTRELFRRLGLSHLLVVSGLHLGMLASFVLLLGARLPRSVRLMLATLICLLYATLVGPQPSVLRATGMVLLIGLSFGLRRPPQVGNILATVVGFLVVVDPGLVERVGFQLSVAATAGIVFLGPLGPGPAKRRAPGRGRRWVGELPPGARVLLRGLGVTASAQIATLPWTVGSFHWFPPWAVVWNLVALPWSATALALSLVWVGVASVAPVGVADSVLVAIDLLTVPVGWLDGGGWSSGRVLVVHPGWLTIWFGGSILVLATRIRIRWVLVLSGLLFLFGTVTGSRSGGGHLALGEVGLTLIDVGQGDALLLRDQDHSILVDGGGWTSAGFGSRVLAPALVARGVERLDLAVISHSDLDHCQGVADLRGALTVGEVVVPAPWDEASVCADGLRSLGVGTVQARAGASFRVGAWSFEVLGPLGGEMEANRRSLVVRAEALGRCVLLTGDIDSRVEDRLRARWGDSALTCDVLKVAHHGSASSSSAGWLYASRPAIALVSAGRSNRYGHPAPVVLRRLENRGIWTLRTDRHGEVDIAWGRGTGWRVRTRELVDGSPPARSSVLGVGDAFGGQ